MALLGLLLLPSNYRAGAEARTRIRSSSSGQTRPTGPFATTSITGWRIRVQVFRPHGLTQPSAIPKRPRPLSLDNERPDAAEQQESAPVSSGVHLLLMAMMAIVALGMCQAPIERP